MDLTKSCRRNGNDGHVKGIQEIPPFDHHIPDGAKGRNQQHQDKTEIFFSEITMFFLKSLAITL